MARDKSREPRAQEPAPEPDDVKNGAAVTEIEQILASIDRDEIDLDELGQKVERAVELLKVCRAKLKATEARVVEVLKDLEQEEAAAEEAEESESESESEGSEETEPPKDDEAAAKRKPRRKPATEDEELPF